MAFATQCPHCQTTFRVAHDQLKLRAGLVRCGACKEIFNGVEHLLRSDEVPVAPAPVSASHEVPLPPHPQVPFSALDTESVSVKYGDAQSAFFVDPLDALVPAQMPETDVSAPVGPELRSAVSSEFDQIDTPHTTPAGATHDPVEIGRTDLEQFEDAVTDGSEPMAGSDEISDLYAQHGTHESADELDQEIDYLQRKPWRRSKHALSREADEDPRDSDDDSRNESDVPGFVARSRGLQQRHKRVHQVLIVLVVLVAAGAIGQSLYVWRDQIAARLPASKPALISACQLLGCRIELPAQIDAVSIESNELVTLASEKNNFALNLLLRNRSTLPQRWPAIELTLLDNSDRPVVRRVFSAVDYLPSAVDATRGFAQDTEQSAKITFEFTQQKAANYRVYLFYP